MKEIIKILKNYKILGWFFWITFFILIIVESNIIIFPQILKNMMEIIEIKWNFEDLLFWWYIGFWLLFFTVILWYIAEIFEEKLWWLIYSKRYQFYREKLLKKNFEQISNEWTWKLLSRFTRWAEAEANIFLAAISIFTNSIFKISIIIIIFAFFLPQFLILVLLFISLMFLLNLFTIKKIKYYSNKENEIYEESSKVMIKMLSEFLVIKIFWKEKNELNKSKKLLDKIPYYWPKRSKYQSLFYSSLFFVLKWLEISIFVYIWYFIIKWELSISLLTMLVSYLWVMWNPIDVAINKFNQINKDLEAYKKLQEFIEKPNDIENWEKEYIYKNWKIEFKNIDFGYSENNKIFENLNFELLAGKKNALVGHSWGWKSTIIKILLRLYDYQKWEILLDWQELKELKIESFYKEIWYLPQEPGIFDGSIRENMEYAFDDSENKVGNENFHSLQVEQEKQIWQALEKAQISEMIKKLEKWLDTEVWEKWVKLSWGEKQRLAIARIFLKNPKIIILDEPTSALDSISEAGIRKALDELMKNRTSVVIAHRLQTVMHSDKIIVLENGKIESEWTHNELMRTSETYKTLVDLQNGKIGE